MSQPVDPVLLPLKELLRGATALTIVDRHILLDHNRLLSVLPETLERLHLVYDPTETGYNALWYLHRQLRHIEMSTQMARRWQICYYLLDGCKAYGSVRSINQTDENHRRYISINGKAFLVVADYMTKIKAYPFGTLGPVLVQVHKYFMEGEDSYDEMYDSKSTDQSAYCRKDFMEAFQKAIHIANQHGLTMEAEHIAKRMNHCEKVYRTQFSFGYQP